MERDLSPLASHPPEDPREEEATRRFCRVFGEKRLSSFLNHRRLLRVGKLWFVFVDPPDARCFTRIVKLAKPVRNPRSITGSQKYIANAKNSGVIF